MHLLGLSSLLAPFEDKGWAMFFLQPGKRRPHRRPNGWERGENGEKRNVCGEEAARPEGPLRQSKRVCPLVRKLAVLNAQAMQRAPGLL